MYTRYVFEIDVLIRYRVQYRIAISGYKDIECKNFDVVHDIGVMSGYKDIDIEDKTLMSFMISVQCRDIRTSMFYH
jgi:hypothetical protein